MKVAMITGASKGIGASLAKGLAKEGYFLFLGDYDKERLKEFTKEIKKTTKVFSMPLDIRKKKSCEKFIEKAVKKFGRIDLLVNNAGIWDSSTIDNFDEKRLYDVFQTDLFGAMFMCQAAVKVMKAQRSGHMLNIGSTAGVDPRASFIIYGTAKNALIGFTARLREELKDSGVIATICSPGGTKTNLYDNAHGYSTEGFMDPGYVADKIIEHIKNPDDEWNCVIRRPA